MENGSNKEEVFQGAFPAEIGPIDQQHRDQKTGDLPKDCQCIGSERFVLLSKDEWQNHELSKVCKID